MIKVNDIRTVHDADIISFKSNVNLIESDEVGDVIQKIFQEINNYLLDKDIFNYRIMKEPLDDRLFFVEFYF